MALGLLASLSCADAAIVATSDFFTTDTTANYTLTGGYTSSYVATSPNFGDGNDGMLTVGVPGSNNTGFLRRTIGNIDASDVGSQLSLTFRVDGRSANFHSDITSFTLNNVSISSTDLNTEAFAEWDGAGDAAVSPAATLGDWRQRNGVGTINYTIQAGDVGQSLGWEFDSAGTSGGGFGFGLDNWELSVVPVPEPSSTALLGLAGIGFILRRRR